MMIMIKCPTVKDFVIIEPVIIGILLLLYNLHKAYILGQVYIRANVNIWYMYTHYDTIHSICANGLPISTNNDAYCNCSLPPSLSSWPLRTCLCTVQAVFSLAFHSLLASCTVCVLHCSEHVLHE